MKKLTI